MGIERGSTEKNVDYTHIVFGCFLDCSLGHYLLTSSFKSEEK